MTDPRAAAARPEPAPFSLHCKRCGLLIPRGTPCVVHVGPYGAIQALYHRVDCSAGARPLWRLLRGGKA
ncbi:MAG TPA: hypothetical protein VEZ44_06380 [bacterium]|nr:hypothetical protein [bacterium]